MNEIEKYYNKFNEDKRLTSRHGIVEFTVTMENIKKYIPKKHCKIIEKHLNYDEKLLYVFAAQKNNNPLDVFSTYVIALTNKRLVLGRKRLVFGYFFDSITPDMFNDLNVMASLVWGKIHIDTINEYVTLSNIDKKALPEIETMITSYMIKEKRKLGFKGKE